MTTDSNEKPSGPIVLSAGIVEGSSKATTRTVDGNHAYHLALTTSTQLALQVSGTWIGHGSGTVVQTTTATVGAETPSESKHNALTCNPTLYWDDYGSADPANMVGEGNGRDKGLTIYGAAINGKTTAPEVTNWTAFSWTLPTNQGPTGSQPADMDLLISNNISGTTYNTAYDGNYRFDQRNNGKLLEFKHALSKITVILTANNGFPGGSGNEAFEDDPQVTLTSNEAGQSTNAEWAYRTSNINVTNGAVSSQQDLSAINMYQATANGHTVSFEALVMPGSQFASDNAIIARINADGNIYYVTAEKIRTAISDSHASDGVYSTEAGKNYIIKVTVDKTGISKVSATVTNWTNVEAVEVYPKINVTANWGDGTDPMTNAFSFYRSTSLNTDYGTVENMSYYKRDSEVTYADSKWTMSPTLYWPDHDTHYQFRAVLPATVTTTGDGFLASPRVITANGSQVIKVKNEAYSSGYSSNLMIARPEITSSTLCNNSDHESVSLYDVGICATEGTINLNFRYVMSQVEVNLATTGNSDPNHVNLTNAKVELTNVYDHGNVKLGDRTVDFTGYSREDIYLLHPTATSTQRLDAIVPQNFSGTKFKITIYKNGDPEQGVDDIYYADITNSSGGWVAGNHYVYNLTVTKTDVQVSATLTNWDTVNANHSIWF